MHGRDARGDRRDACPTALCLLAVFLAAWPLVAAEPAAEGALRFFEQRLKADPDDFLAWNQLAERQFTRFRETGDDAWLTRAGASADASLKAMSEDWNPAGLALRARADLAAHRFASARDHALRLRDLQPAKLAAFPILADALLELGDLDEATRALDEFARRGGDRITLAPRLARLAIARGRTAEARAQLAAALEAARELSPPSPLTTAWCEVQLGELAFRSGDWETAEARYAAALAAMPGWWTAREHLAELRGAQSRDAEALAIYEELSSTSPRPELLQAAGDLCLFLRRDDDAKRWHDRALAAYLAAVERGASQYAHHLAGFYCDSRPDAAEALKWARQDLELRQSAQAHDALAWALYRGGDFPGAVEAIGKALATGVKDAHVQQHAGLIRMSAGDVPGGRAALREAAAINPHFQAFHAHR